MKAGADGLCVNHREKPAAAAAAPKEERALMPGEKPAQVKTRRAAKKTTTPPAAQGGVLGQVLGGVVLGLAIVGGIAWALFAPAPAAAEATKLRAVG